MQTNDSSNTSNQVKPDEFRLGDTVWCLIYGKGEVYSIMNNLQDCTYPMEVIFENGDGNWYTLDGKLDEAGNRTLFFSEPKIEASVTRPFVPTLVGKKVVVIPQFDRTMTRLLTVFKEDSERIYVSAEGHYWDKDKIDAIYEISSENLLKP